VKRKGKERKIKEARRGEEMSEGGGRKKRN
jgi:hypothetical protein